MPKLRIVTAGDLSTHIPASRRATGADFGAGVGQATQDLGRALGRHADVIAYQRDQDDRDWAFNETAKARTQWTQRMLKLEETTGIDQDDLTPGELKNFDTFVTKATQGAPSDNAARLFKQNMANVRQSFSNSVIHFDATRRTMRRVKILNDNIRLGGNTLLADPDQFPVVLRDTQADITSRNIPFDQKEKLFGKVRSEYSVFALQGMMAQGDMGELRALNEVNAGKWDAFLDPDAKTRLLTRLNKRREQAENTKRAEFHDLMKNYIASLRAGNDPDLRFTDEFITRSVGEKFAKQAVEDIRSWESFSDSYNRLRWATPAEAQAVVNKESGEIVIDDFIREDTQKTIVLSALAARNKALLDDPAEYVLTSEAIRTHYKALEDAVRRNDTGAIQMTTNTYAVAILAEQARLGVPVDKRRILSKAYTAAISEHFKQQREGGQNAATLITRLAQQWGNHWPQVQGDLIRDKRFDSNLVVLSSMTAPEQGPAAIRFAEVMQADEKTLEASLPVDIRKKDIEDQVKQELADFLPTVLHTAEGYKVAASITSGTTRLAMRYVGEGATVRAAAQQAAHEIATSRYEVRETYRIPVGQDADTIETGASVILLQGQLDEVTLPESPPGVPESFVREQYLAALANRGYWITAPHEDGLILMDETGTAVTWLDGRPVFYSWDDLIEAAVTGEVSDPFDFDN